MIKHKYFFIKLHFCYILQKQNVKKKLFQLFNAKVIVKQL